MLSRNKAVLAFALALYLVSIAAVATALYFRQEERGGAPVVRQVSVSRNAHGRLGLKLAGTGLTADTRLLLMADTIDSDILRAHSLERGHMFDVEASGDYLWVAKSGVGIQSYLRHHEPLLAVESHLDLTPRIVDIEIVGSYLYALSSKPARLYKVSIIEPEKPRQVGVVDLDGKPVHLWTNGEELFVADYALGLWRLSMELEVRKSPKHFPELASAWRLAGREGEVFVITLNGELWRLELSHREARPALIRDFGKKLRGVACDGRALHIFFDDGSLGTYAVKGETLRALQEISFFHRNMTGLHLEEGGDLLVAIDPARGAVIYRRDVDGLLEEAGTVVQSGQFTAATVVEGRLFTTSSRGISSWDLEALAAPRIDSHAQIHTVATYHRIDSEEKLILASELINLQVSEVGNFEVLFRDESPWRINGLSVSKGHVWLGREDLAVTAYHVDTDGQISPCMDLPDTVDRRVLTSDTRHLALGGEKSIEFYELDDPCHPRWIATLPLSARASDVLLDHELAYVASGHQHEVVVISLAEGARAVKLGSYVIPRPLRDVSFPRNLLLQDDILYVSLGQIGLLVLDVSDPVKIRQLFFLDTPGFSMNLKAHDGVLYVSDGSAGLWLLDLELTQKARIPRVIGSISTAIDPRDIYFHNGRLFLAGGIRGIAVMDEPVRLTAEYARFDEAFYPLPEEYQRGRFRMLAYNAAGRMHEDRVVIVSP